jgi:hypothetical protein
MVQRRSVQFGKHIAKLGVIRTAPGEAGTIGFAQCAYARVAVLTADLAVLVPVPGRKCRSIIPPNLPHQI